MNFTEVALCGVMQGIINQTGVPVILVGRKTKFDFDRKDEWVCSTVGFEQFTKYSKTSVLPIELRLRTIKLGLNIKPKHLVQFYFNIGNFWHSFFLRYD